MEGENAVFVASSSLLVASSDPRIAAQTAQRLRARGFHCVESSSASAAIELLISSSIDTLIVDVALLRDFPRENEASPLWTNLGVPAIALVAEPTQAGLLDAFEAKVSGVLLDPLEGESLFEQVHACLEHRHTFVAIEAAGARLGGYVKALDTLKGLVSSWPRASSLRAKGFFIQMSIANIAAELTDMKHLIESRTDAIDSEEPPAPPHPDGRRHVAILKEVVAVLEDTRASFKSKRLAALRRRLEEEILQR